MWKEIFIAAIAILACSICGQLSQLEEQMHTMQKTLERIQVLMRVSSPQTRPHAKMSVSVPKEIDNGSYLTISASQEVVVLMGSCLVGRSALALRKPSSMKGNQHMSEPLTSAEILFKHPPLPHATIEQSISDDGMQATLVMKGLVPPGISLAEQSGVKRTFAVRLTCQWLDYEDTAELTIEVVPKYTPAIDLGTHSICAAYVDESGSTNLIDLSPYEDGYCISSAPWICEQGIFLGAKVPSNKDHGCERLFDVKRKLGDFCQLGKNIDSTVTPTCVAGEGCELTVLPFLCKGVERQVESELVVAVTARIIIDRIKNQLNVNHLGGMAFTFPPEFPASQRAAFFDAIRLTNEDVELALSEPLAAVVENQYQKKFSRAKTVLVLDLGHGTIGIQLLIVHPGGHIRALSTAGFGNRGGRDLDIAFAKHINKELKKLKYKWTVSAQNAEKFKILLSKQETITVKRDCVTEEECKEQIEIKNSDLDEVCANLFGHVLPAEIDAVFPDPFLHKKEQYTSKTQHAERMSYENLDEVLVVGGASRAPCLRRIIIKHFEKRGVTEIGDPQLVFVADTRDPKLVVAVGAAVQAARLSGLLKNEVGVPRSTHSAILARDIDGRCTQIIPSQQAMDGLRLKPIEIPVELKLINGRRCLELSFCEQSFSHETETKNISCDCQDLSLADKQIFCDDNIPKGLLKADPPAVLVELAGTVERNGSLSVEITALHTMRGNEISRNDGHAIRSKAFSYNAGHFDREKLNELGKLADDIQTGKFSCDRFSRADKVHIGRFCDKSPNRLMKLSLSCTGDSGGKTIKEEQRRDERVLTVLGHAVTCEVQASLRHPDAVALAPSTLIVVFEKHKVTHEIADTVYNVIRNTKLSANLYLGVIALSRTTQEVFKLSRMTSSAVNRLEKAMDEMLAEVTDYSIDLPVRFGNAVEMVAGWLSSLPDDFHQTPLAIIHVTAGSQDLPLHELTDEKSDMWTTIEDLAEKELPPLKIHHLLFHPQAKMKQLEEVKVFLTTTGKLKNQNFVELCGNAPTFKENFIRLLRTYRTAVAQDVRMKLSTTFPQFHKKLKVVKGRPIVLETHLEGTTGIILQKDHILHANVKTEAQEDDASIVVQFETPKGIEETDLFSVLLEWFDIAEGKLDAEERVLVRAQRSS